MMTQAVRKRLDEHYNQNQYRHKDNTTRPRYTQWVSFNDTNEKEQQASHTVLTFQSNTK